MTAPGSLLPETRVVAGRYVLGAQLGHGGMATVYQAHDGVLDRAVAIKLFGPSVDAHGPERVRHEMRLLATLNHPHLVTVYDAGTDVAPDGKEQAFLVMRLVDGPSLRALIANGPIEPARLAAIGADIAAGLACVHEHGVIHRDLKPANVLIDRDGCAYLADFGIARSVGSAALTEVGLVLGTAAYLSPEQVSGTAVTTAADVYSLGLVLLEALTGRREYEGTTAECLTARLVRPPVVPQLPGPWTELLQAMTATDPQQRPTAAQVEWVLRADGVRSTGDTRVLRVPSARHQVSWRWAPVLAGVLAALAVVAALAWGSGAGRGARPKVLHPLPIADAVLYHPGGSAGDHPGDVPLSHDGSTATSWRTQHYASAAFGNLRPGVGVVFDLGRATAVRELHLDLTSAGAAAQVRAADSPDALLSAPVVAGSDDTPLRWSLRLQHPVTARFWLVWFSRLPDSGGHQAGIAEAVLLG